MNLDGYALPIKKLKGTEPVESLDLSRKGLGVASAIVIASLIGVNGALKSIDLSSNQLTNYSEDMMGIKELAAALGANGVLTSIDLSNNQLCGVWTDYRGQHGTYTAEGITAIADAMRVNGALTKLSLARNKLEEAGTKAICEALEQNTTLKELDISGDCHCSNTGGSAGAKHVAKMLRVNDGLTALDLSSNDLKDEGVRAVCKAIQSNKETKLASLNFKNNGIGPGGANAVAAMVAVTGALMTIE